MNTFTYVIEDRLYINLTNQCTNDCEFCIRRYKDGIEKYYLWLDREPTVAEVIEKLHDADKYKQVVFCGFGEPLMRLNEVVEIGKYLKSRGIRVRLNTNGQALLIYPDTDVPAMLADAVDKVSISLNASDAEKYDDICHSVFGREAYPAIIQFAKDCLVEGLKVRLTIMDIAGEEEVAKAKIIADDIGAELFVRKMEN